MALATLSGTGRFYYPFDARVVISGLSEHAIAAHLNDNAIAFGGSVWFKERTGNKFISRVGLYVRGNTNGAQLKVSVIAEYAR
jgi:hypothetical protein